jgi:ribosome-associated translation inhibitor RaiA
LHEKVQEETLRASKSCASSFWGIKWAQGLRDKPLFAEICMQVLVNSDHHITASEDVTGFAESVVASHVDRFANRVTRVEVFLSDSSGSKHGARDKRCVMEARVSGAAAVVATGEASSLIQAIEGAGAKLERALEHAMGRLKDAAKKGPREADTASVGELEELEKWDKH